VTEAPLAVAVRDHQHFNRLLAAYAVVHVTVDRGPAAPVVILNVESVTPETACRNWETVSAWRYVSLGGVLASSTDMSLMSCHLLLFR